MFHDTLRKFNDGTLVEKNIITEGLSGLGSDFYYYYCFLKHHKREKEAKLIENLRTIIFNARDNFSDETFTKLDVIVNIRKVKDLWEVQETMLASDPEKSWENCFTSNTNNALMGFMIALEESYKANEK